MLQLKNLSVFTKNKKIIDNVNFDFEEGKIYAIMGPNGSGKSTLANAIMGNPDLKVDKKSKLIFKNKNITDLPVEKRAKLGIFMTFQSPIIIQGVNIYQLLKSVSGTEKSILEIHTQVEKFAEELNINKGLLERSLNENASGGERKKLELMQAFMLNKEIIIFDEIDTGVDVDAMKTIGRFVKKHKESKTYIFITHYTRILKYIKPDAVIVLNNGRFEKIGDYNLAKQIETKGYSISCEECKACQNRK